MQKKSRLKTVRSIPFRGCSQLEWNLFHHVLINPSIRAFISCNVAGNFSSFPELIRRFRSAKKNRGQLLQELFPQEYLRVMRFIPCIVIFNNQNSRILWNRIRRRGNSITRISFNFTNILYIIRKRARTRAFIFDRA